MILRDSQLSERRSAWPAVSVVSSIGERVKATDKAFDGKATLSPSATLVTRSSAEAIASPVESKERPLTFESVVAWLAVQDQETRNACASILATEVTKTYETAKNDGFAAGRKAAEVLVEQETKGLVSLLQEIAANAQVAFDQEEAQLQGICVEVVGEALAKIAGPLLATKDATVGAIKEVLRRVKEARELTIRVTRDDFTLLKKYESELAEALAGRKYEIVADNRVELGGCIVETKLGNLDGRMEVQLRELYETLRLAKLSMPELS